MTFDRLKGNRAAFGALLESYVFAEIMKLMSWSDLRLAPYHFRDQQMHEVDIVLERDDGMIVGIEIKATASVTTADFAGIRKLMEACGKRFALASYSTTATRLCHLDKAPPRRRFPACGIRPSPPPMTRRAVPSSTTAALAPY